jgi:hypothetical protein
VTNSGSSEQVLNITWGGDAPPIINGRYIVVNRNSGKVMEVAGGSSNNGANIQQNPYTGATYQQWDIVPLSSAGGDLSVYAITAAHSGKAADVNAFSYDDGGNVQQRDNLQGANQHWFFEYVGNGWFYVRSAWSGKCLDVAGASTANGANIWQWTGLNGLNQQWRLIPVGAAVEFVAPAAPTGFRASANAVSVQLDWNASGATDLAGYTVLRATNVAGPYDLIARGLTNNAFTDKSGNQPRTYFYYVKAVDKSLNSSGNAGPVAATPTAGPALVARYPFDGNLNDSSGNANHPIIINGSPAFVAGHYGSCSGNLRFAISTNGNAPGAEQILETAPLPAGQWQHVAVTRSGNTAKLYTNGVVAASGTVTIAPASFNPALNYLGASQYPDPLFNGRLDEFFIYNYVLSSTEITRLMNNQPPPPVTPTTLATSLAGNTLNFSWPANYVGCRLESNSLSLTATGSWFTVAGSASTNQISIPLNASRTNVFFRLAYP